MSSVSPTGTQNLECVNLNELFLTYSLCYKDGKILFELILKKLGKRVWSGFTWLRVGPVVDCCEYGIEPSGFIKSRDCFELLKYYQFSKNEPVS
jgi:hypothetical protein